MEPIKLNSPEFSTDIKKTFKTSFIVHFSILLLLIAFGYVQARFLKIPRASMLPVETAVRVDVVEMPKYTLKELQQARPVEEEIKPVEAKKEVEVKEDETVKAPELLKEKKKTLQDILKNSAQKEVQDDPKNKKVSKKFMEDLQKIVLAGNKVSQGNAATGTDKKIEQTEFSTYISALPDLVRANWVLPSYLRDKNLRCRVRIFIAPSGNLLSVQILESSGEQEFDNRALQAVKRAAPFPTPKESIKSRTARGDIVLGFPL